MNIEFGSIVLVRFPFTDLSGTKRRPALVIAKNPCLHKDILFAYVTTKPQDSPTAVAILPSTENGLKETSWAVMHKLAAIEKTLVVGKAGLIESDYFPQLYGALQQAIGFYP